MDIFVLEVIIVLKVHINQKHDPKVHLTTNYKLRVYLIVYLDNKIIIIIYKDKVDECHVDQLLRHQMMELHEFEMDKIEYTNSLMENELDKTFINLFK